MLGHEERKGLKRLVSDKARERLDDSLPVYMPRRTIIAAHIPPESTIEPHIQAAFVLGMLARAGVGR